MMQDPLPLSSTPPSEPDFAIIAAAAASSSSPASSAPITPFSPEYDIGSIDCDWNALEDTSNTNVMTHPPLSPHTTYSEFMPSYFVGLERSGEKYSGFSYPPAFIEDQSLDMTSKDKTIDYASESLGRSRGDVLSQESSFTDSVSSRAHSEGDEVPTNSSQWHSLSDRRPSSQQADDVKQQSHLNSDLHLSNLYAGLSEAFSQQQLAEPLIGFDHQSIAYPTSHHDQDSAQSQPLMPTVRLNGMPTREGSSSGLLPNFNFEDFIADREHLGERPATTTLAPTLDDGSLPTFPSANTMNQFLFQQQADQQSHLLGGPIQTNTIPTHNDLTSSATSTHTEHHGDGFQNVGPMRNPPSTSYFSSPSSLAPSSPRTSESSHGGLMVGEEYVPSPSSSHPSWVGGQASGLSRSQSLHVHGHGGAYHHVQALQSLHSSRHTGAGAAIGLDTRSLSPNRPVVHPSLMRLARSQGPVRSSSTSDLNNDLSCNPQHITPPYLTFGNNHLDVNSATSSPSSINLGSQSMFNYFDGMDSPSSSTMSSPQQWHSALASEDGHSSCGGTVAEEEETYRQPHYASATMSPSHSQLLSGSLPTRPSMLRHSNWSSNMSNSSSPSSPSLAGQPIRSTRSSTSGVAAAASSPYSLSPAFTYPSPLPPHLSQRLADPYSGVITKRSRGRRVPSTPEEMTNVGKSGKVYTCKVPGCGKLFKRSEHLKRHIRSIHTDEKPFTCKLCLKKFSRHDNLNQHMRVHGGTGTASDGRGDEEEMGEEEEEEEEEDEGEGEGEYGEGSGSPSSFVETRGGTISRRSLNRSKNRGAISLEEDVFSFEDDVKTY